ncbi:hypothetical protein TNCV_4520661 [Trichonephila clavipes]|nr:hypothetical protein TNCV_4520661 [Trichonephila clavipes]
MTHKIPTPSAMAWSAIGCTTRTAFVNVIGNLNSQCCISQFLKSVDVSYLRSLGNVIFQQDDATSHAVCRVLMYLEINGFCLLPWPASSPNLSPVGNIGLWAAERIDFHRSPTTKMGEV